MKRVVSLILAVMLVCSTLVFAHPFTDVKGHWAETEIEKGYTNKTINGDPDGRFRPDETVTRAEFLKMLTSVICTKYEVDIPEEFADDTHWASKYYNFANMYIFASQEKEAVDGVIPGVMTTAEDFDKEITRWEMAFVMSGAMANLLGQVPPTEPVGDFKDIDVINFYSPAIKGAIFNCNVLQFMTGDEKGMFNPSAKGTRAEAVTVINRVDKFIQDVIDLFTETTKKEEEEYNKKIQESLVTYEDIPSGHPIVTMVMSDNKRFMIELYPEHAPQTVANFVKLVKDGFYNGLTFHRIVPGFVAQGGDPKADGTGGSGSSIKGEFSSNGFGRNTLSHTKGIVSMARSSHPDSASSQFFICYDDASFLDGSYAAFGKVVQGMNVVEDFTKVELEMNPSGEIASPVKPIVIKSATVSMGK